MSLCPSHISLSIDRLIKATLHFGTDRSVYTRVKISEPSNWEADISLIEFRNAIGAKADRSHLARDKAIKIYIIINFLTTRVSL